MLRRRDGEGREQQIVQSVSIPLRDKHIHLIEALHALAGG